MATAPGQNNNDESCMEVELKTTNLRKIYIKKLKRFQYFNNQKKLYLNALSLPHCGVALWFDNTLSVR
ncbi:hypothetical protein T11_1193 [Trichinella zimbabwensis]|uniref:Uncharacterized protein n=1 Tax=Trichinella zimbabwensis TaxID=268475 RepID=A0A0V1I9W2_9BILA|nr:hypothetical protein T11_1193 [Trichinella zimbabwensis]